MEQSQLRRRTIAMLAVVVPTALAATALTASIGRLDTALLFVGVPCLMALAIGLMPTDGQTGAAIFQVVTVVLLLVSAFLHEGALCVLIVSPLVYGLVYGIHALATLGRRLDDIHSRRRFDQRHAFGGVLVALMLAEGIVPSMRINPDQSVHASRVVATECATFTAALDRGPDFSPDDRGLLLRLAQYPLPTSAEGAGLEVGDTWTFPMPAGEITTRVAARETAGDRTGHIAFDVVTDTARTTRWVTLRSADLTWEQTDDGCRARVDLDYTRDLDPAIYFGPVTEVFMKAGASAFLAGLA